MYQKNMSQLYQ